MLCDYFEAVLVFSNFILFPKEKYFTGKVIGQTVILKYVVEKEGFFPTIV